MAALSSPRIRKALADSDVATTTTERGRLLEDIIAYMFARCRGVRHHGNNLLNAAGSSEIDVCFWNSRLAGSFDFLPEIIVVECKNTADPLGSAAVRIFESKLRSMRLGLGILVATNGITGNEDNLRAAHDVIRTSFQTHELRIIVLTRAELEGLKNTDDLMHLLQDKILRLTMQASTFSA